MNTYRLADLPVELCHKYPPRPASLLDFKTDEAPLFSCAVDSGEIERMATELAALRSEGAPAPDLAFCETFALYLALGERLPLYDGFLLHATLLTVDGVGVAILAPSGTGKTTLAAALADRLPDNCRIVNGDKPLVRRVDGRFFGYGTPFCGKEGWYRKERVPIEKLIFLRRSDTDTVTPMRSVEAFPRLYEAVHLPKDGATLARVPALLSALLGTVTCYDAALTKERSAAECVYQALFRKEIPL